MCYPNDCFVLNIRKWFILDNGICILALFCGWLDPLGVQEVKSHPEDLILLAIIFLQKQKKKEKRRRPSYVIFV